MPAEQGDRTERSLDGGEGDILRFAEIEADVNEILAREWRELSSNPEARARYGAIFERTVEDGFYLDADRHEAPGAGPNAAYIQSHEEMWQPVDRYLESVGLRLEANFRDLFPASHEYEDTETEHRRVFWGQLCNLRGTPVTAFILTVWHSHERFHFSAPMRVSLSPTLSDWKTSSGRLARPSLEPRRASHR
jgi:hypothetical protein